MSFRSQDMHRLLPLLLFVVPMMLTMISVTARAGAQVEEALSDSVRTALCKAINETSETERLHGREPEVMAWLNEMSPRLASRMPDPRDRMALLATAAP